MYYSMPLCLYASLPFNKKQSAPVLAERSCEILFRYFGRFLLRTGLLIEISGFQRYWMRGTDQIQKNLYLKLGFRGSFYCFRD
jgi:hypothetical protein